MKVGFPRTLTYFSFFPFWRVFFREIGHDLVPSPSSNKRIMDLGVQEAISDACVPVKLFFGHVVSLIGEVEYMFIPRLVSIDRFSTFCPKFLGLPEMIFYSVDGLPPILDNRIDVRLGRREFFRTCQVIGHTLGAGSMQIIRAYNAACREFRRYKELLHGRFLPQDAMDVLEGKEKTPLPVKDGALNLAVLGYPYQLYDPYINLNLIGKLSGLGVNILTSEMLTRRQLLAFRKHLPKNLFWHFSNNVIWATYHYLKERVVDGVIHLTAFGCGPDAIVDKIMELDVKASGLPFMSLSIDEQTGEGGMTTRLEAFVDMLRFRKIQKL